MTRILFGVFLALIAIPTNTSADDRPATDASQRVTVRLTEYRFDPPQIEVKVGKETELTLVNEGTVLHEFVTKGLSDLTVDVTVSGVVTAALGIAELEIPPKATVVLRFTPTKAGEFPMWCDADKPKNHRQSGMQGTMTFR